MREIKDIKEVHAIILGIAKEFHRICVENEIPYYMLGGTMLGAIRHRGFIPWDDDMDFGVPRKYISKLIVCLKNELPQNMKIILPSDDYGVVSEIIKVSDFNTIIDEQNKEHIKKKMGLFIDIFPLDESDNNWKKYSRNWIILFMQGSHNLIMYPSTSIKAKLLRMIVRCIPDCIYYKIIGLFRFRRGDYISNYSGAWGHKETVPKECFATPVLYDFEDEQFFGVSIPEIYLKALYNNYMELPPVDKRHIHLDKIYIL